MKKLFAFLFLICIITQIKAQKIDILQKAVQEVNLAQLCSQPYAPYPAYEDRAYWQSLPEVVKDQAIAKGVKALDYVWKSVSVTSYLDFRRTGQRQANDLHIAERHDNLSSLVMAELVEGQGRFIDAIANGVWSLCEQSTWVASAHISNQRSGIIPDVNRRAIDLSSGETANALSWTYYFLGAKLAELSPLITQRMEQELDNHILKVYLDRDDLWWQATREGAFVNNWNVWCNFNVLLTALLVEKDPARKERIVKKTMRSVDQFINYYKNDGGCEEGPSYWDHAGGKLMEYLALLDRFSAGKINLFTNDRVKNIGLYIAKAHIDSLYFVNFADAQAKVQPIPTTIYRYGKSINDKSLMQFGSYIAKIANFEQYPLSGSLDMRLWQTELYTEICATIPRAPLYGKIWLPGIEMVVARSKEGSTDGFTFAAKGGFNDESHNHNDAGSFLLYLDGQPLIIDAGVGTYTAKTFSDQRYEIWTMQSEYHNLPIINGYGQKFGKDYRATQIAYRDNGRVMNFALDLSKAYPSEAGCRSWIRDYELNRAKNQLIITDNYILDKITSDGSLLTFMVDSAIRELKPGVIEIGRGVRKATLTYDDRSLTFAQEKVALSDPRLSKIWGESLTRISLKIKDNTLLKNTIKVILSY